jgi:hypothetical protein
MRAERTTAANRASPRLSDEQVAKRAVWVVGVSIAVTLLLYLVPYGRWIGYPLVLISTVVHEMGHGVAGWLVGGHFESFRMYADGSGVAEISGYDGRFSRAFVSAGGLCGPAVIAAIGLVLARRPLGSRIAMLTLGIGLALVDLLLVRSFFGWFFILGLAAIALAVAWKAPDWGSQLTLSFLSIQLALSVFSRGDYLFTDVARTQSGAMPSDVANMASALFLPYWFWGAACGLFSVAMLALGAWLFLRGLRPPRQPKPSVVAAHGSGG